MRVEGEISAQDERPGPEGKWFQYVEGENKFSKIIYPNIPIDFLYLKSFLFWHASSSRLI